MLKLIEHSYINSTQKVKLQLLVLPIFFIYFYFYFYSNKKEIPSSNLNNNLTLLENKKFNKSHLELVKDLEKYFVLKKIKINSIDYKNKNLLIKGETSILKIKSLINKLESINKFSNITLLNILKTKSETIFNFEINTEFKKYYIKKKQKIEEKKKVITKKLVKKEKKKDIKLNAIISNHILINNTWQSIDDKIGKYTITKITTNSVLLSHKEEKLNLKLHKDE